MVDYVLCFLNIYFKFLAQIRVEGFGDLQINSVWLEVRKTNGHSYFFLLAWASCCKNSLTQKQEFCAALEHRVGSKNVFCKQMTPLWQIILNEIQANIRGAAYIMDLSVIPKITLFAETLKKVRTAKVTSPLRLQRPLTEKPLSSTSLVLDEDTEENKWSRGT